MASIAALAGRCFWASRHPLLATARPSLLFSRLLQVRCAADGGAADSASSSSTSGSSPPVPPHRVVAPALAKVFKVRPITKDDVEFAFSRSSGAGGQNVNKVSTKVDMRLDLGKAAWIPLEVRDEMRRAEKNRVTLEGMLVVTSQKHRVQAQNLEDALEKLQTMINNAVEALTPTIADAATIARVKKSIKAGQERRIQDKKKDAVKKKERSRKDFD